MDPITWTIIGLLVAGAAGAAVATAVLKREDILTALSGKRIAVLGARRVGKTTLLRYIENGILLNVYKATTSPKDVEKVKFTAPGLELRLKSTRDVAGSGKADRADLRLQWKNLVEESDIVLYLVRTDKLLHRDRNTAELVKDDLEQIGEWIKGKNKQVVIVGNHWNTDPKYDMAIDEAKAGKYQDEFMELPSTEDAMLVAGERGTVSVALGSLADERNAQILVTAIFTQVVKNR